MTILPSSREAGGLHAHDADVLPRLRLALLQHLAARVDRLAFEERVRQPHLVPSEVGHHVDREIDDRLSRHERQREGRVDQRLAELGLRGVGAVEVDRVRVLRQQREPAVVDRQHRPPERMRIDVADLEVLVDAPRPALFHRHAISVADLNHEEGREDRKSCFDSRFRPTPSVRSCRGRCQARRGSCRCARRPPGIAPIGISMPSKLNGGTERADGPGRRRDLAPAVARGELRMIDELLDRVHPRVGDLRRLEPRDHLVGGQAAERLRDDRVELVAMLHAPRVRREAWIGGDLGPAERLGAEADPLALVLKPEVDDLSVAGLVYGP